MKLTVATSQFPGGADIRANTRWIKRHMEQARYLGADVVHFHEGALSGYAGFEFASFDGFDWPALREATEEVMALSGTLGVWVVLGSAHPLSPPNKPHNSLYIINDHGELLDRYDKMFCAGNREGATEDLPHYTPGDHFCTFTIRGVRCGVLICHEFRYPELYREYKRRGVQVVFHSFHAGHVSPERWKAMRDYVGEERIRMNPADTLPGIAMPAAVLAAAGSNYLWMSCSNTSRRESCWPAFSVRPDGVITGRLRRNVPGVLVSTVHTEERWYDASEAWRERAMNGVYHSGVLVEDPRSEDRTAL